MAKVTALKVKQELRKLADPKRAKVSAWFFKTKLGQYGYGDVFIGLTVPQQRQVAKKYVDLSLTEVKKLLTDKIHECRLVSLLILVAQFERTSKAQQKKIYNFYLNNTQRVNNWDLVDLSAPNIVGQFLLDKSRTELYLLARSKNLWQKRIAIVATSAFIRQGDLSDTFKISRLLLNDSHDLIHKAVGWMLREAGKKNQPVLEKFLDKNIATMPRTTLRYAIERFSPAQRRAYVKR